MRFTSKLSGRCTEFLYISCSPLHTGPQPSHLTQRCTFVGTDESISILKYHYHKKSNTAEFTINVVHSPCFDKYLTTYIYNYSITQHGFTTLKILCYACSPLSLPLESTDLLLFACVCVLSCSVVPNSCEPIHCSLPGSSVSGILQARIL